MSTLNADVETEARTVSLLAAGLALVYHEGRHVRHLVKAGHVDPGGWEVLLSLPTNRVDAWRAVSRLRAEASTAGNSATKAVRLFAQHFRKTLEDLEAIYENEHWKHAEAFGGHAWRGVTAAVVGLRHAIVLGDFVQVGVAAMRLIATRDNNGEIRQKIRELDQAIGYKTGKWWP